VSDEDQTSHLFKAVAEVDPASLEFQPGWYSKNEIAARSLTAGAVIQPFAGGKIMGVWVTIEPNIDYPHHQHPHEQMGILLEGALELTMGDETRLLRPGDAYAIPPYLPHKARTFEEGCVVFDVFSPPREDYLG
jgi:quercetin dioxygenase-like cupin family protein